MSKSRRTSRIVAVVAALSVLLAAFGYLLVSRDSKPAEWQGELVARVGSLNTVRYTANRLYLAAGSGSGAVVVWNLRSRDSMTLPQATDHPIVSLETASRGFVGATDTDRHLLAWQLGSSHEPASQQLPAVASCLAFRDTEDGPEMVLGLTDGSLTILDPKGNPATIRTKHVGSVRRVVYSPDGRLFVTGGADGQVLWYDADGRRTVGAQKLHETEIGALAFSPDGQRLTSGDWNGLIVISDVKTYEETARHEQPDAVSGIEWINGQPERLLTGSWDGMLRFYSSDLSQMEQSIDTRRPVYDLDLSHDGTTVAVASGQNAIELWQVPLP